MVGVVSTIALQILKPALEAIPAVRDERYRDNILKGASLLANILGLALVQMVSARLQLADIPSLILGGFLITGGVQLTWGVVKPKQSANASQLIQLGAALATVTGPVSPAQNAGDYPPGTAPLDSANVPAAPDVEDDADAPPQS